LSDGKAFKAVYGRNAAETAAADPPTTAVRLRRISGEQAPGGVQTLTTQPSPS